MRIAEGGRLFVKGPNVMLGYYRTEHPGVLEAPADGWHDTGDIVSIDAQGFITIKGRAKRFAKIGGEMVSLSAVEALASEVWPTLTLVAVALPDARKGERIVLMTNDVKVTREQFLHYARGKGAPDLIVPSEVLLVDRLPCSARQAGFCRGTGDGQEKAATLSVATKPAASLSPRNAPAHPGPRLKRVTKWPSWFRQAALRPG